jgi:hypothetical protein
VVVHNLDVKRIGFDPSKTNSPLIVDPNAVLPQPIAGESLKAIPGNGPKIGERRRCMNLIQLSLNHSGNRLVLPAEFASEDLLGLFIPKGPNHSSKVLLFHV